MIKWNLLIISLFSFPCFASKWVAVPGFNLHELYSTGDFGPYKGTSEVIGTTSLSWPNGDQAIVTHIERIYAAKDGELKSLYRCIDYYDATMNPTGSMCYELRE